MRVLALAAYPEAAAATRFRVVDLVPELRLAGIDVTLRPFLDAATYRTLYDRRAMGRTALGVARGVARRLGDLVRSTRADVVLVQREAMLLGPPVVELVATALGRCPLVLDLDDATWVGYDSPTYGALTRVLKWPTKTLTLIERAATVTCGSRHVADFVTRRGGRAALVPPVVDTGRFRPGSPRRGEVPVVGWVGTHSTARYLRSVAPALASAGRRHPFRLRIVGAGPVAVRVAGVDTEAVDWSLAREAADFASLDVGLYPLPDDDAWAAGKSALKSVQYMACGVPFVASPVGAAAQIGEAGTTHLLATDDSDWEMALTRLLDDAGGRAAMGANGRRHALEHHTTRIGGRLMADALLGAAR